ncbi:MAG: 16S rRNA (cytidine(1402)-2'-O)-methyltransferase [Acidimicrobiia bacterium]|nr:16S rRNA (cytidine(1402)-2'-O)-methyltransferase [Acidimicrobiia bacterium]MDH3397044.1 16S rRNA (cytidine(1402)-2'-O)-methyltransferase [Acidimicrobiia bacterium]
MTGRLVVCATPIGNLGDASPRLAEVLRSADVVYAEDTRRSRVLLTALDIDRPLRSYFVGNEEQRSEELAGHLEAGQTVALITDAGMPSISDPGVSAVSGARRVGAEVQVVPGPSAVTAALAVSGFDAQRFVFEGFLPRKGSERKDRLAALASEERTIVMFSATHRVARDLADLASQLGTDRPVAVCRELTKRYEEVRWDTLAGAVEHLDDRGTKGEYTVVIQGGPQVVISLDESLAEVLQRIEAGEVLAAAVRTVATLNRVGRRVLYEAALDATKKPLAMD